MAHIHTEPGQHDHTASAYIIRTDFDEPRIMLHWHKKLGRYMQFGGHIELDESPWMALERELLEETGYHLLELKILQPRDTLRKLSDVALHPTPAVYLTTPFFTQKDHIHTEIAFAFSASGPPIAEIAEGESTDIILLTRSKLESLPNSKIFENVREIGLFIFDTCLTKWEEVDTAEFSASV